MYFKAGVISKRKTNMQLRVLSRVKVDKVSTSQFNLTTSSNIIKKRNIIIVTYENWFLYSVVKNILVLEHRLCEKHHDCEI